MIEKMIFTLVIQSRAQHLVGRPGTEIFDLEKNLILNPEPGPGKLGNTKIKKNSTHKEFIF